MKYKNKLGFTLIEIIICIAIITSILSIFSINFIKTLNKTKQRNYDLNVSNIEEAAEIYVLSYKNNFKDGFEDIKNVILNTNTYMFISVNELVSKGFLDNIFVNPINGKNMDGVIKFSNDANGIFKYEYLEKSENYFTIKYNKNGVKNISRTFHVFPCSYNKTNDNLDKCLNEKLSNISFPKIEKNDWNIDGWATNKDIGELGTQTKEKLYGTNNTNSNLISAKEYIKSELEKGKKTINFYATTHKNVQLKFKAEAGIKLNINYKTCNIYNNNKFCEIPILGDDFSIEKYYRVVNYENEEIKKIYPSNTNKINISKDETLTVRSKIDDFNITRVIQNNIKHDINLVFVADSSSSMKYEINNKPRFDRLKEVIKESVDNNDFTNNSTLSLIQFGETARKVTDYPINVNSIDNKKEFYNKVDTMGIIGGTKYGAAFDLLKKYIYENNKIFTKNKKNVIIFISDGHSHDEKSYENVLNEIKSLATIYSLGIANTPENEFKLIASSPDKSIKFNGEDEEKFYNEFNGIITNIISTNENVTEGYIIKDGLIQIDKNILIDVSHPFTISSIKFDMGSLPFLSINNINNQYFIKNFENGDIYFNYIEWLKNVIIPEETDVNKDIVIKYFIKNKL